MNLRKILMNKRSIRNAARIAIAAILSLALTAPALAADVACQGAISASYVDWDGNLLVSPTWRGDWLRICSVRTTITGNGVTVDPTTCMGWASFVRQAMSGNKQTVMRYRDVASCTQVPSYYSSPLPEYLMVLN
jgi:hypothetical protein